jgi:hypothetical protein
MDAQTCYIVHGILHTVSKVIILGTERQGTAIEEARVNTKISLTIFEKYTFCLLFTASTNYF